MSVFSWLGKAATTAISGTPVGMALNAGLGLLGSAMDNHANKQIAQQNYDAQMKTNEANIRMNQETNQTNRQIAQENNLFNRENLEMQNQWNIDQWNRENAYNDPSAQASRLIAAGINPANAGLDGSGTASSIQSAQAAPASESGVASAPQIQAPRFDYSQTTFREAMQNALVMSQAANTSFDTQERMATLGLRISEAQERLRKMKVDTDFTKLQKKVLDMTQDALVQRAGLENKKIESDILVQAEQVKQIVAQTANTEADTAFKKMQPQLATKGLELKQQEIDNAAKAAQQSYYAALANVAAQRYSADMSYKAQHEAIEEAKRNSIQQFGLQLKHYGLNERQVNLAVGNFQLAAKQIEWEQSGLKYLQDISKSLAGSVGSAAAGAFGASRGAIVGSVPSFPANASYTIY